MWKKSNLNAYSFEVALPVQGIKGVLVCCIRMLILSYAIDAYLCLSVVQSAQNQNDQQTSQLLVLSDL